MMADPEGPDHCELCDAAQLTEWFYADDECWIAECESCAVPMVVWRSHDPDPPAPVRDRLWALLGEITTIHFDYDHYIDDHLRSIPGHYHAHARPRDGFSGYGRRRRGSTRS